MFKNKKFESRLLICYRFIRKQKGLVILAENSCRYKFPDVHVHEKYFKYTKYP